MYRNFITPPDILVRSVDDLESALNTAVNFVTLCWLLVTTVADEAQVSGIIPSTAPMQRYFIFYFKDLLHRNSLKYMWGYKIVPITNSPH